MFWMVVLLMVVFFDLLLCFVFYVGFLVVNR